MKATLINHMGDDLTVVNAARVSFDKQAQWEWWDEDGRGPSDSPSPCGQYFNIKKISERDAKLINYLAKHGHWTPFSHPQLTFRYDVPIFVARQEFKHIVGFTRNEVSRRYVDDTPEFYTPEVWRSRPDGSVKQGSGLAHPIQGSWNEDYLKLLEHVENLYSSMIEEGVAPEQARMILPQSMYTSYYITGSLAAFARFFRQRTDEHAQKEIQELAYLVGAQIQPLFPASWEALAYE